MGRRTWGWIAVVGFVAAVVLAFRLVGPSIPNEIRFLAGPEGTTFHEYGLQYRELMSRHGVVVDLEATTGSLENLSALMKAESPTVGFVEGFEEATARNQKVPEGLESLGTMALQPVWVFAKQGTSREDLKGLTGSRVAAGEKGSDARLLAVFLLRGEGVDHAVEFARFHPRTPSEAVQAMGDSEVAALIATGAPDSALIDALLRAPELQVVSIRRAAAFAIRHPFLEMVEYPEGAHDLRANIPDRDLRLLAARAQLVVPDSFPPALADLLLQAAEEIHRKATPFSKAGEFPNAQTAALPLNGAAAKFYRDGPPSLQRVLPFRLATWIDRLLAALVAIASAAIGIFKVLPLLLTLPFRLKVMRAYRELEAIERSAEAGADKGELLERLAAQDRATAAVGVPVQSVATQWFELRQCLHDMRDRIDAL